MSQALQNLLFDEEHRQMFLNKQGWEITRPLGQDSSIRRYFRVKKGDKTAILMETVPDDSAHATPGHSLGDFIRIAGWLRDIGLKAPEIYERDLKNGYLLLEDFGDTCFRDALDSGEDASMLYGLARDILDHIAAQNCSLDLPDYYDAHVHRRHRRVVDWFMPLMRQCPNEEGLVEEYHAIWTAIEKTAPPARRGFLHIDFHAQNLMWLPGESGLKRCGILDFQGAMIGPHPYDLTNLLEDARRDAPADVKAQIIDSLDEETRIWFRILATQFHCRVIGQFIRQAVIDENPAYLKHIPRLQNYLAEGLKNPIMAPLAHWFTEQGIDFTRHAPLENLESLRSLIAEDAQ
ncbi:MAG: phosphotransferase [Alphaproteobacteria bacterium]|nr:phosphotransferase [Alphaproteobacteria bacterium]